MSSKILLTSFTTWESYQKSNSSDDLLAELEKKEFSHLSLTFLRKLPVDVEKASKQVIATIDKIKPDAIICCGMAEGRKMLTVESNARWKGDCLSTTVNLPQLIAGLSHTAISDDAGQFVCEGLYYHVLNYINQSSLSSSCIFVHIPILTETNQGLILKDMELIVLRSANKQQTTKPRYHEYYD